MPSRLPDSPQQQGDRTRLLPIDAARGAAMFFVFLAHFGYAYLTLHDAEQAAWVSRIGKVASPTFMAISGMMLGFLYQQKAADFHRIRRKLIDRGLFLLTIGHALIVVAHIAISGSLRVALTWGFITDAIGFSIVVGPLLIPLMNGRSRGLLALGSYVAGWIAVCCFSPAGGFSAWLKETLVGDLEPNHYYFYNFPLLPWFSLYLASSVLGERVGEYHALGERAAVSRLVMRTAAICLALALPLLVLYAVAGRGWFPVHPLLLLLSKATQKLPPAPAYFLFYSSVGFGLMGLLCEAERRDRFRLGLKILALVGRTSLFVFVLQYYVYFTLFVVLPFPYTILWPLYLAVSAVAIVAAAHFWSRRGWNRFITVGMGDGRHMRTN